MQASLLIENMMNVLLFVPFGFLCGCSYRRGSFLRVLAAGGSLSIIIEALQYVTKSGFAEFDDVMHNTLGCFIGYLLYLINQ